MPTIHTPSVRLPVASTGMLVCLLSTATVYSESQPDERQRRIEAAQRAHGMGAGDMSSEVIVAWNSLAHDIAVAEDQFRTFKGQRALAMMHLAMHDALNAIVPIYERYAFTDRPRPAHPTAATAQAAHDVLVALYPDRLTTLADQLAQWLAKVPDGSLKDRGTELGQSVAAAILARRQADGWDVQGSYEFTSVPGHYQTTPPWNGFVAQPGFRLARPFVLDYPHQFRPPPPPPLRTAAYARALREVNDYGGADSASRSDDQSGYAIWWMEFAEGSVNRLARQLAIDRRVPLWTAARLFAHVGVALYDTYIATWDAKYTYDHWRPYTAIRSADTDENPRTTPNTTWESLRPAPPFPEYVSAHAAACSASFGVLQRAFGDPVSFTMATSTAPPDMPTRAFASFQAAATECADSRVQLGWHFRYATEAGLRLGTQIARYTMNHSLRRAEAATRRGASRPRL